MKNVSNLEESDVIFVADMFVDDYAGGGELSTESLFKTSPYSISKIKSNEVNEEKIKLYSQKIWVFFNFRGMDHNLIPTIIQNLNYFIVEFDFKLCQYRSLELHKIKTGKECDCHEQQIGKIISAFFHGAECVFYMSEKQKSTYQKRFPFLEESKNVVLSSIFDEKDLVQIENLRKKRKDDGNNNKWAIVDGNSWIKGIDQSRKILDDQGEPYDLIGGLTYSDLLRKLSEYKGLCATPLGADTCPRLVIEAKLLGLELKINDNVLHADEEWFLKDLDQIEIYLLGAHERFWTKITNFFERDVTLSGYTTAYNVMQSDYPWKESIISMLGFCDEVIVLDGGSNDGTWEELQVMEKMQGDGRLVVKQLARDWESKEFALFDGQQKAAARTLCTKQWCWQQDIDEVVHEEDYKKVKLLIKQLPKLISMVSLPVVEFWGGSKKIRVDVNPWKQRLSKNTCIITHGINEKFRSYDNNGRLFSKGSDGCEYIIAETYQHVPDTNFYTPELHAVRMQSLEGDLESLKTYERYMNQVYNELPGVFHYSWFDIERKIHTYKNYWSKHWMSLFNKDIQDTIENNMFFNKKWCDVSDKEIVDLSDKMAKELGGWVFHRKLDFNKPTPWISCKKTHPKVMKKWISKHEKRAVNE